MEITAEYLEKEQSAIEMEYDRVRRIKVLERKTFAATNLTLRIELLRLHITIFNEMKRLGS